MVYQSSEFARDTQRFVTISGIAYKLMKTQGFLNLRLFENVLELETPTTYLDLKKNTRITLRMISRVLQWKITVDIDWHADVKFLIRGGSGKEEDLAKH